MNLLFLHPNFPAQFQLLARELANRNGCHVVGVGQGERDRSALGPIKYHCYENLTGPPQALFPPLIDLGDHVRRGQAIPITDPDATP